MRITIVGCGYVGTALATHWSRESRYRLTLTTTSAERIAALQPLCARVLVLQASNRLALQQALGDAEVAVFCLAPSGTQAVDAQTYDAVYRASCEALVELLPALPQLRQIIYTGSCAVYGDAAGRWVDESSVASPRDEHGQVLLASERLLEACRNPERQVCVLRLGAIYGPGRELGPRLSRLAGTTRPGDGRQHGNWIHLDDVVGAIDMAVRAQWDGVINLVDDQPLPLAELLDDFCRLRNLPVVQWDPSAASGPPMADRRVANRLLHRLGYQLRHPRLEIDASRG